MMVTPYDLQDKAVLPANMKKEEKIGIELTKKQFLALLKAVYLGNWMANANRDGSPEDPHVEDYEKIEDLIFSF